MKEELDIKLLEYAKCGMYPFHMPGHKRKPITFANPYTVDITEIEGFDNLSHPEGILKEAQQRAAALYGSKQSYYLINGSTGGILTAVCACVKRGGKLLMARNTHKAVYHGAYLHQLSTEYIYPAMTETGILGAICPKQVEEKLKEHQDIEAVIVTSPTYEGLVSDIAAIAQIVHKYGIPLIVDEAHGAHLGLSEGFPISAVKCGADIVVHSMHKVLPSLTQSALLHFNSKLIKKEAIERFLGIFQTSSPSYVLMGSMDKCIRMLREEGTEIFAAYSRRLQHFYEKAEKLIHIRVLTRKDYKKTEFYDIDASKIIISVKNTNISGKELYKRLLEKYHLQMEMVSGFYVLGMTSIMDDDIGFERLIFALMEIDVSIRFTEEQKWDYIQELYIPRKKGIEYAAAMDMTAESISLSIAREKISGSFVYLYPPGIPVIVPGEVITLDFMEGIQKCITEGLTVEGDLGITNQRINVVNF